MGGADGLPEPVALLGGLGDQRPYVADREDSRAWVRTIHHAETILHMRRLRASHQRIRRMLPTFPQWSLLMPSMRDFLVTL
ncbi:hypothetical protein Adi01nite_17360 [Amorphoplanes digitatis]|nr:hypothetical protein Adi01nite_17360 [Actinoplanes digitatis]